MARTSHLGHGANFPPGGGGGPSTFQVELVRTQIGGKRGADVRPPPSSPIRRGSLDPPSPLLQPNPGIQDPSPCKSHGDVQSWLMTSFSPPPPPQRAVTDLTQGVDRMGGAHRRHERKGAAENARSGSVVGCAHSSLQKERWGQPTLRGPTPPPGGGCVVCKICQRSDLHPIRHQVPPRCGFDGIY